MFIHKQSKSPNPVFTTPLTLHIKSPNIITTYTSNKRQYSKQSKQINTAAERSIDASLEELQTEIPE